MKFNKYMYACAHILAEGMRSSFSNSVSNSLFNFALLQISKLLSINLLFRDALSVFTAVLLKWNYICQIFSSRYYTRVSGANHLILIPVKRAAPEKTAKASTHIFYEIGVSSKKEKLESQIAQHI